MKKNFLNSAKAEMDIIKYAESIAGLKLLDYQKIILRNLYEAYKNNKDMKIVMNRHNGQFCFLHAFGTT